MTAEMAAESTAAWAAATAARICKIYSDAGDSEAAADKTMAAAKVAAMEYILEENL